MRSARAPLVLAGAPGGMCVHRRRWHAWATGRWQVHPTNWRVAGRLCGAPRCPPRPAAGLVPPAFSRSPSISCSSPPQPSVPCRRWRRGGRLSSRLLHDLQRRTALACSVCDPGGEQQGQSSAAGWACLGALRYAPCCAAGCLLLSRAAGEVTVRCLLCSARPPPSPPSRRVALPAPRAAAAPRAGCTRPAAVQHVPAGGWGCACTRERGAAVQPC